MKKNKVKAKAFHELKKRDENIAEIDHETVIHLDKNNGKPKKR